MPLRLNAPLPLPTPLPLAHVTISETQPGVEVFWSALLRITVIRTSWSRLSDLLRHELLQNAAVYILSGTQAAEINGRYESLPHFYVGEGGRPPRRLPDHRSNEKLGFTDTIYVLGADVFTKSSVVYLQERMAALISNAKCGILVQGCAPTSQPITLSEAQMLDQTLGYGLTLLRKAGCPWLR